MLINGKLDNNIVLPSKTVSLNAAFPPLRLTMVCFSTLLISETDCKVKHRLIYTNTDGEISIASQRLRHRTAGINSESEP